MLLSLLREEEAREADKARLALGPSARKERGEASVPPAYRRDLANIGLGGYAWLLRSRVVFCSLANAKCCTIGLDATNCLKPLRASCDRSIAKEKSERCPVETALVLKSTLRCSQGDRRYHSGSICFALTLLRERELNDE